MTAAIAARGKVYSQPLNNRSGDDASTEHVVRTLMTLASDAAGFVNGRILQLDAGMSIENLVYDSVRMQEIER